MAEVNESITLGIECGKDAAKEFGFADGYRNLNHGSFGTYPNALKPLVRRYQDDAEARPDHFIRYDYPKLLDQAREAVAEYLHVPVETCVFVPNATTGLNTVLRNLVFQPGDVILYMATTYGACEKTIEYITETTPAESLKVEYTYPISDHELCERFEAAIGKVKVSGKVPKVAVYDTIVSLPGVRVPFERLTRICKHHGILSCIDGAHGIGHLPLDLGELDADFFFSNCHKWLYVPRGCAIFYVPERNQQLMRSTLPTSHGFQPLPMEGKVINNPLPASANSKYVTNFEYVGSIDSTPHLCVPAAIAWRQKITWRGKRGEEAIFSYLKSLAKEAGDIVAKYLGTEVMKNAEDTSSDCAFSNVRLPMEYAEVAGSDFGKAIKVAQWIAQVVVNEYETFIVIIFYGGAWWVRLSAQVYLTVDDFKWATGVLKEVCGRVKAGEWER